MNRSLAFVAPLLLLLACRSVRAEGKSAPDFDRIIAPLFAEHCLECHGGARPKGGLDLTTAKGALHGGKRGSVLVPGKPDESRLWERVDAGQMPPRHPLPRKQRDLLHAWIAAGATWGKDPIDPFRFTTARRAGYDWWSLAPHKRATLPDARASDWPRNPIDRFVLARLQAEGLTPSPEADRRSLLRRLSFDLIGLAPTPEEVDAFLADARPNAYERQVERLLASPHYGERWARHWLDVVRFGETNGFERNDARPNAWHYRDWVIRALNADMPYDEFCRLQIAGDVLRPGEADGVKATGYLVTGIHNTVVPMLKSARDTAFQDELEDLVGNVGQTFLGLTVNCARCHDHKFDPVSQKEYYALAATLAGVRHGEREVTLPEDSKEAMRLAALRAKIDSELAALEEPVRRRIFAARKIAAEPLVMPAPLAAWDFRDGLKDQVGSMHVSLVGAARLSKEGLVLDGKSAFGRSEPLPRELQAKTLEAWVRLENTGQRGGGVLSVQTRGGEVFDAIVFGEKEPGQWLAGSDFFRRTQTMAGPPETESGVVHLAITYSADGTIAAYRNGKRYGKPYRSAGLAAFPAEKAVAVFGVRHEPANPGRLLAGVLVKARLYDRALTAEEVTVSAQRDGFVSESEMVAGLDEAARKKRAALLAERILIQREQTRLTNARIKVYAALSTTAETTRVLHRGQVSDPGEIVAPGGVAALGRADFGLVPDAPEAERRRKLALWITHAENPLFARVMVNRLWHHHFGAGIVDTPSDLGFNGGRPTHPELLDWLAAEFAAQGFSLKKLHRLMVTSNTYRQASLPRKDAQAKDADTRLLWRMRPRRLDAESVRDSMLLAAGLLNREVGGKGFSDYKESGGAGTQYYDPFDPVGPAFHRRSLYRFLPRGGNAGLLDVLDCPDPAASAPRRNTTTTPLQALALWNGPFGLRMAQALAERVVAEAPRNVERQIERVYQLALQRRVLDPEREPARRLAEEHGLRALCRAVLNSNEFLYVD